MAASWMDQSFVWRKLCCFTLVVLAGRCSLAEDDFRRTSTDVSITVTGNDLKRRSTHSDIPSPHRIELHVAVGLVTVHIQMTKSAIGRLDVPVTTETTPGDTVTHRFHDNRISGLYENVGDGSIAMVVFANENEWRSQKPVRHKELLASFPFQGWSYFLQSTETFHTLDRQTRTFNVTRGQAYINSMCTDTSQSVVEQRPGSLGHVVAAHELAHSLGARHDGHNNDCLATDNYIMSSSTAIHKESEQNRNTWLFSPCSKEYVWKYISDLDRLGINCLLETKHRMAAHSLPETVYPEYIASADEQCRHLEGDESSLCREFYDGSYNSFCALMYCRRAGTSTCSIRLPLDTTPCGRDKMCKSGICAPTSFNRLALNKVTDTCPFGNQPDKLNTGESCGPLINEQPWRCYEEFYRTRCCDSCNVVKTNDKDCYYGDRDESCRSLILLACYFDDWKCCKTCTDYKGTPKEFLVLGGLFLGFAALVMCSVFAFNAVYQRLLGRRGETTPTDKRSSGSRVERY